MKKGLGWILLGPWFLNLSFAAVLLQNSKSLGPFLVLSLVGSVLSSVWKKRGFALSFVFLVIFLLCKGLSPLSLPLICSILLSWLLISLGKEEMELKLEENAQEWKEKCQKLEEQLLKSQRAAIQERKEAAKALELMALDKRTPTSEGSEELRERLDKLQSDYERALQWEVSYQQMRKQFEEKSDVLSQIRKEFFQMEGQLIVLQKDLENRLCEPEGLGCFAQLDAEHQDLENQVDLLQQIVTTLSRPKKVTKPRKTKSKQELQTSLPLIIQDMMDGVRIS